MTDPGLLTQSSKGREMLTCGAITVFIATLLPRRLGVKIRENIISTLR